MAREYDQLFNALVKLAPVIGLDARYAYLSEGACIKWEVKGTTYGLTWYPYGDEYNIAYAWEIINGTSHKRHEHSYETPAAAAAGLLLHIARFELARAMTKFTHPAT